MPARSNSTFGRESLPTRSVSSDLSKAMTAETFATESFGRPVARAVSVALPGASAHFMLLVNGTQTAVASRLRFDGALFLCALAAYAAGRWMLEPTRETVDRAGRWSLNRSISVALMALAATVFLFLWVSRIGAAPANG